MLAAIADRIKTVITLGANPPGLWQCLQSTDYRHSYTGLGLVARCGSLPLSFPSYTLPTLAMFRGEDVDDAWVRAMAVARGESCHTGPQNTNDWATFYNP